MFLHFVFGKKGIENASSFLWEHLSVNVVFFWVFVMTAGAVTLLVNVVVFFEVFDDVVTLSIKVVFFAFSGARRRGNVFSECPFFFLFLR